MYDLGDNKKPCAIDNRLYCSLCLADIQKQKGESHSATAESHISKISNFSTLLAYIYICISNYSRMLAQYAL